MSTSESTLSTAAEYFSWKPAVAWFRSLELQAYEEAGVVFEAPVLDLGCGDATVADTLAARGMITTDELYGIDYAGSALERARSRRIHVGLSRADARRLPFRDGAFGSVFSNGVLCAIAEDGERSLTEVARVLRPGGVFAATVPTDQFVRTLLWPRVLSRLSRAASEGYVRRMNRRLEHLSPDVSAPEWRGRFYRSGLVVDRVESFFSEPAGRLYNVLAMHIFRFCGIVRSAPTPIRRAAGAGLRRSLTGAYERELARDDRPGYVLLVGHRRRPDESGSEDGTRG